MWDLATGNQVWEQAYQFHWITTIRCCPDGLCALGTPHDIGDVAFRLHRLNPTETAREFVLSNGGGVNAVAPLPDGRAVSAGDDGVLRIWDLAQGIVLRTLEGGAGGLSALDVTPDGRGAVSTSWTGQVQLWNLETGAIVATFQVDGLLTRCAISWCGQFAVAGERSGALHMFQFEASARQERD